MTIILFSTILFLLAITYKYYQWYRMSLYEIEPNESIKDISTTEPKFHKDAIEAIPMNEINNDLLPSKTKEDTHIVVIPTETSWTQLTRSPDTGLTHVERTILGPMVRYMTQPIPPSYIESPTMNASDRFFHPFRRKFSKRTSFVNDQ